MFDVVAFLKAAGPSTYQQIADGLNLPLSRAKRLTDKERNAMRVIRIGKYRPNTFVFAAVHTWALPGASQIDTARAIIRNMVGQ